MNLDWPLHFSSHCAGNPRLLRAGSFPPWCHWSYAPDPRRAAIRPPHPLPFDLPPHHLQPHHLHPYQLLSLSQQHARHAPAASLRLEPSATRRLGLPATQLLRQRELTRARWCPHSSVDRVIGVALHRHGAVSYWCGFTFDLLNLLFSGVRTWAVQLRVTDVGHCGLLPTVCGRILIRQTGVSRLVLTMIKQSDFRPLCKDATLTSNGPILKGRGMVECTQEVKGHIMCLYEAPVRVKEKKHVMCLHFTLCWNLRMCICT